MSSPHAIAAAVAAARKQQQLNDALRGAVTDADDAVRKAQCGTDAMSRLRAVEQHMARCTEGMAEFERSAAFHHTRRANPARFLADTNQRVEMEALVKPTDTGSVEAFETALTSLRNLRATAAKRQKQATALEEVAAAQRAEHEARAAQDPDTDGGASAGAAAVARLPAGLHGDYAAVMLFLEQAIEALEKMLALVQETSLDAGLWGTLPNGLLALVAEVLEQPSAAAVLEQPLEVIQRMSFEVDDLEHRQGEAVAEGDMELTEVLYFKRIAVQEATVKVFDGIYRELERHQQESAHEPLTRVQQVHQGTNSDVSQVMGRYEQLKGRVEQDTAALDAAHKAINDDDVLARGKVEELRADSDAFLAKNAQRTADVYRKMAELEREAQTLAAERSDAIEQRLALCEDEDKRRADVALFNKFHAQHHGLLDATQQTVDVAEEVTDLMDEVLCNGCNALEQRLKAIDAEAEAARMHVHDSRLKHFRRLYLTLGDLQYKKERNIEALERKIEHTNIQQELALETFNPKAKEFSDAKKQLMSIKDEMVAQVQALQDKATLQIEAFKPTEAALLESGKAFVHPVAELQAMNSTRQQKMIEYQQLMSRESGDGEQAVLDIEEEKTRIEAERMAAMSKPRQPLTSSGRGESLVV